MLAAYAGGGAWVGCLTGFLPQQSLWANVAPTWNDTSYRNEVMQGQVSDANSYALGGIAGHAGVFMCVRRCRWGGGAAACSSPCGLQVLSSLHVNCVTPGAGRDFARAPMLPRPCSLARAVPEAIKLLTRVMFAPDAPTDGFLNSTTVKLFTTAYNLTQSSRALGWDTNDYVMNTYRGCGNFSALTYTHTGYTGACARVRACACVCVRVRACACVCVRVRACACVCVRVCREGGGVLVSGGARAWGASCVETIVVVARGAAPLFLLCGVGQARRCATTPRDRSSPSCSQIGATRIKQVRTPNAPFRGGIVLGGLFCESGPRSVAEGHACVGMCLCVCRRPGHHPIHAAKLQQRSVVGCWVRTTVRLGGKRRSDGEPPNLPAWVAACGRAPCDRAMRTAVSRPVLCGLNNLENRGAGWMGGLRGPPHVVSQGTGAPSSGPLAAVCVHDRRLFAPLRCWRQ